MFAEVPAARASSPTGGEKSASISAGLIDRFAEA
jgi:hypothetical protein